jgi:hypothetical protein
LLRISPTSRALPQNFDKKRLVGAIRTGAALLSQVKVFAAGSGYYIKYLDPATNGLEHFTNSSTIRATRSLNYLPNLGSSLLFDANIAVSHTTTQVTVWVSDPDMTDATPSTTASPLCTIRSGASGAVENTKAASLTTDSGGQVADRSTAASTTVDFQILGYHWPGSL